MESDAAPILHLIVGPNGAGKTTFYELRLARLTDAEFVNADQLARERFGSRLGEPPRRLISFAGGRVIQAAPALPGWARALYAEDLARR